MYAKLFARITESSIMDEKMEVRYTFVMLLAIADPTGHVIGTDVAIARRLNMPLSQFLECIEQLGSPDPNSNSKEEDGRRVIPSIGERGYKVVNYPKYRDIKDEAERREYMRKYMQEYRKEKTVNSVNNGKPKLTELTQVDVDVDVDVDVPVASEAEEHTEARAVARRVFEKPSLEACKLQAAKCGLPDSEAEKFFNYYESNGWRVGKNPMRSWPSAMANWKLNYGNNGRNSGGAPAPTDKRNIMLRRSDEENAINDEAFRVKNDAFLAEARRNAKW